MTQPIPLRSKSGLPRHCYWEPDRHGKRRVRFRKGTVSAYLTGIPWSERFMRQYAVALERLQAQASNIGAERIIAGTFDHLCVSYYQSPDFHNLKPAPNASDAISSSGCATAGANIPLKILNAEPSRP